MENFDLIGEYKISKSCLKTFPCKYKVLNTSTNMSGDNLHKMLKEKGLSCPRFKFTN
jgi:beta-N-acetylglucosaminidase